MIENSFTDDITHKPPVVHMRKIQVARTTIESGIVGSGNDRPRRFIIDSKSRIVSFNSHLHTTTYNLKLTRVHRRHPNTLITV